MNFCGFWIGTVHNIKIRTCHRYFDRRPGGLGGGACFLPGNLKPLYTIGVEIGFQNCYKLSSLIMNFTQ